MTTVSAVEGYSPSLKVWSEQEKYEAMWNHDAYRHVAPGEGIAQLFLAQAKPRAGSTVIDFGAGTGRGALMLALMGNLRVRMLDFASNCLDEDVRNALTTQAHALDFTQHDLTKPAPFSAEYGYCTDVMEHIPKCQVNEVLKNILQGAQHVFFQIACEDDVCGKLIGQPLHLSVHPYEWWLKKLQEFEVQVHWSQDFGTHCCFYVTAWQSGEAVSESGVLNTAEEEILRNVTTNLKGKWQEFTPQYVNDEEVMILGGGPSMTANLPIIHQ
jgi:Methyltransferase domain